MSILQIVLCLNLYFPNSLREVPKDNVFFLRKISKSLRLLHNPFEDKRDKKGIHGLEK